MKVTGAKIVIEELIAHGVRDFFGYPGGTILDIYDEIYKAEGAGRINHYITSHEQHAVHAADGYARVTGRPGVMLATSGPGATNTITGIANAYLDHIPLVVITGNVPTGLSGRDSFQEVYTHEIARPICKETYKITCVEELADTIRKAFKLANSGQKGPVLIDIPKDIQQKTTEYTPYVEEKVEEEVPPAKDMTAAIKLIKSCKKPFIVVGGGVVQAGAWDKAIALADMLNAPIGCSLMGKSAGLSWHPNYMGTIGMHGKHCAQQAVAECDLLIALGTRFSDRVTGDRAKFSENMQVLQLDIDKKEIDKNIKTAVSVLGDVGSLLSALEERVAPKKSTAWLKYCLGLKKAVLKLQADERKLYHPNFIISEVAKHVPEDTVITTDVGQHQMWAQQYYPCKKPRTFVTSGGLGTMGFGIGAAVGASIAKDGARVVCFTSDGSFHMNMNEVATAVSNNLPLLIVLLDNNALGMVRQWQDMFYEGRRSSTILSRKTDYVKLVEAMGGAGFRVDSRAGMTRALKKAVQINDKPVVIHAIMCQNANVYPFIPPGGTVKDVILKGDK